MKKILQTIILPAIILSLGLTSCTYVSTEGAEDGKTTLEYYNDYEPYEILGFDFQYKGHDYIFLKTENCSLLNAVVHNPDCKKCKEQELANQESSKYIW